MSSYSFRTEILLKSPPWKICFPDKFFCIGSCFTSHLHKRISNGGFSSFSNPCGIVYNPISLTHQINKSITGEPWQEQDMICHHNVYHGLHHHGQFSSSDRIKSLDKMNEYLDQAHTHLMKSNRLIMTLGTSIVYIHKSTGQLVANCHKLPAGQFERRFLSVEEIIKEFAFTLPLLKSLLPDLQIILTISPVRYLKEGFVDNSLSKSILVLVAQWLINTYDYVHYFPAYEIMLDDLRDYRFYKEDMIHPNDQAVEYIWSKFSGLYFEQQALKIFEQVKNINTARMHRPLHPDSAEHSAFLLSMEQKIISLKSQYPFIELE